MKPRKIAIIGTRDPLIKAHRGIEAAIALFRAESDPDIGFHWLDTAAIVPGDAGRLLADSTGVWLAPGGPYPSRAGALAAIREARLGNKAFLGTCGGFQHGLIEFAENVLGHRSPHQETDPTADNPLITLLSCSLAGGAKGRVFATDPAFAPVLGSRESLEEFNCNYGLNEALKDIFKGSDLAFVAHDESGQVRCFRLRSHPFFIGALFQPERKALEGTLHPIVRAFLQAAV